MREVAHILEREGARGGAFWWLILECGHVVTRRRYDVKSLAQLAQVMFVPVAKKIALAARSVTSAVLA